MRHRARHLGSTNPTIRGLIVQKVYRRLFRCSQPNQVGMASVCWQLQLVSAYLARIVQQIE
jgi:hypothetical protein